MKPLGNRRSRPDRQEVVWPRDELRNLGVFGLGYKGSGKSRLIGRKIVKQDLWRGIPQFVWDPVGGTIDNTLDCILHLPPEQFRSVISRVKYIDCSGLVSGRVRPLPIYYRFGKEPAEDVASRYVSACLTLDDFLSRAPIMGANAIRRCGLPAGAVLNALGCQITEAPLLIDSPKTFTGLLKRLEKQTDDWGLRRHCRWFIDQYQGWDGNKKEQVAGSFQAKYSQLLGSNASIATFGADQPGIDINEVIKNGETVFLDFRHDQQNPELLRFKMLWWFYYILNFIKHRGAGLQQQPLGIVIDEISLLASQSEEWERQINSLCAMAIGFLSR
jgi:hypothetical protein